MSGASLRGNAFVLALLTVAAAIASDWSGDSSLSGVWRFPAALLLLGLAYESLLVSRSRLAFEIEAPEQLYLGRAAVFRFVCTHSLKRNLKLEAALTAPASVSPGSASRAVIRSRAASRSIVAARPRDRRDR